VAEKDEGEWSDSPTVKEKKQMAFVTLPILRGFTEISDLFYLAEKYNAVICGGYARYCCSPHIKPVPAGDVDLFPRDEDSFKRLKEKLVTEIGFGIKHENEISLTLKIPKNPPATLCHSLMASPRIQIIKPVKEGAVVTLGSIETILQNFDFTITRAAIINPGECLVDEEFAEDEVHRVLRLKNIHCPVSSMLRCMKYSKKGYWMRPSQVLRLYEDWDLRTDEYKSNLIDLLMKAERAKGNNTKLEKKEIDELESLLRRD
jgi:hypothetical protein